TNRIVLSQKVKAGCHDCIGAGKEREHMRTDTGQVFRLEDYRPSDYLIPRTHLTFRLDPTRAIVIAHLTIERRAGVDPSAPLILDGDDLNLKRLELDGIEHAAHEATP